MTKLKAKTHNYGIRNRRKFSILRTLTFHEIIQIKAEILAILADEYSEAAFLEICPPSHVRTEREKELLERFNIYVKIIPLSEFDIPENEKSLFIEQVVIRLETPASKTLISLEDYRSRDIVPRKISVRIIPTHLQTLFAKYKEINSQGHVSELLEMSNQLFPVFFDSPNESIIKLRRDLALLKKISIDLAEEYFERNPHFYILVINFLEALPWCFKMQTPVDKTRYLPP